MKKYNMIFNVLKSSYFHPYSSHSQKSAIFRFDGSAKNVKIMSPKTEKKSF